MDESVQPNLTPKLSSRCREIMELVFVGKTNGEIAQVLDISPLTVKNHLLKINRLLGAYNRQNAIYKVIQLGLIDIPGYIKVDTVCPLPERLINLTPQMESVTWLCWQDLQLSPELHVVRCKGQLIKLWDTDFKVLRFFLEHSKTIHTRQAILDAVWGPDFVIEERMVDVHISHVRKALEAVGYGDLITTVRGMGYRTKSLIDTTEPGARTAGPSTVSPSDRISSNDTYRTNPRIYEHE